MEQGFDRRIFTLETFIKDTGFLLSHMSEMGRMMRSKRISRAFLEKIMTVVTAVNGCKYCSWFHAKQAVESGMSSEEVQNLLNLEFETDAAEYELLALLYAQHYAETNRNPEPDMTERLFAYYGEQTANDIVIIIRMIFWGNLLGNTWDAVISRFKGNPAQDSSAGFELLFFLFTFVWMFPAMYLARGYKVKPARGTI